MASRPAAATSPRPSCPPLRELRFVQRFVGHDPVTWPARNVLVYTCTHEIVLRDPGRCSARAHARLALPEPAVLNVFTCIVFMHFVLSCS